MMDYLHHELRWLHGHPWFNRVTGLIALANPAVMAPMFIATLRTGARPEGAETFLLFALLQVVFAFVAIKTKNLGMFVSMVVSVAMSLSIGLR